MGRAVVDDMAVRIRAMEPVIRTTTHTTTIRIPSHTVEAVAAGDITAWAACLPLPTRVISRTSHIATASTPTVTMDQVNTISTTRATTIRPTIRTSHL